MANFRNFVVISSALAVLVILPYKVATQADYGYGCREADLPNTVRRDCHPEPGANEGACRSRGCVWCDKGEFPGFPSCFHRDLEYEPPGPTCSDGYVPPLDRTDCTSGGEPMDEANCRQRNCTWCPTLPNAGIPWCFHPEAIHAGAYSIEGQPELSPDGVRLTLVKESARGQWDDQFNRLTFEAFFQSDYRLRVKIYPSTARFEVPIEIFPATGGNSNPLYELSFVTDPFSFRVTRKENGAVLFDSSAGQLEFADQFLSMAWTLPTENLYGLGENEQRSLKHTFAEDLKYPLWAADQPPFHTAALYGTQPQYTVIEADGKAHAVALVNSNAQEFQVYSPRTVKYITIGGLFDMYFFLGPSPDDATKQYSEAVGRSQMPAYWALGFHLCKYGYNNLDGHPGSMKAAADRTEAAGIPHDVQYGDIDIMRNELDFTYDTERFAGLPAYVQELKAKGIKFVTILDPFISIIEGPGYRPFTLGEELDVWVKKADGVTPVTGRVWPHAQTAPVYFPDYSKPSCRDWWIQLLFEFHSLLAYDGIWIDMNEPANFDDGDSVDGCANNKWNYPPYKPGYPTQQLFSKTLCPDHRDHVSTHYNTHSLYGWFESEPTMAGVRRGTGKRGLVLSRSTFLGSGRWASHWLGDNWSRWSNLHYSIIGTIQFNLWAIPFVGPDTCGFIGDSNADLCQRWMELGAFYTFSRNHNGLGYVDQDPAVWGPEVAASSKAALEIRYTLLPYLYTLFYKHVTEGGAVFRPLWYNYPLDATTYSNDRQFMWGTGLLVSAVLEENAVSVNAYFPDNRFFSYYDGAEVSTRRGNTTLQAPKSFIPLHIAGGNILGTQEPARNTVLARENPLGLIVALDDNDHAHGSLFYDDGDSIDTHTAGQYFYAEYEMTSGRMNSTVVTNGYPDMANKTLTTVRLFGSSTVSTITVNGQPHTSFETKPSGEVTVTELDLQANLAFTIVFA